VPKKQPKRAELAAQTFPVVGIGASAGGLEAFTALLKALPADTGMAFVLIQHMDPKHESFLSSLLARSSKMPVTEVTNGMRMEPNHVFVTPPNADMTIRGGVLRLTRRREAAGRHLPIDDFLCSLAEDRKSGAVGVILSGIASDGTRGLEAIKAEAGITFAQDEVSAERGGSRLRGFCSASGQDCRGTDSHGEASLSGRPSAFGARTAIQQERRQLPQDLSPAEGGRGRGLRAIQARDHQPAHRPPDGPSEGPRS
jgi:hypothetical protein